MQGASRRALVASREALATALTSTDSAQLAQELLSVSAVVSSNAVLQRALADPSRESEDKVALLDRLFQGRVSDHAHRVAATVVAQRWASERDLTDSLEALAVEAMLATAQSQGRLDQVEDELFRFNRIVAGTDRLRAALTDRSAPVSAKTEVVRQLLEGKVAPETQRLAQRAIAGHRRRRFDHAIEGYLAIAARLQEQLTATVITAVPLEPRQVERLSAALAQQYGRSIHLNLVVDPHVVGGLRIEIGDEVIDGTIVSRLDEARRRISS